MTGALEHLRLRKGRDPERVLALARKVGLYGLAETGHGLTHYQLTGPEAGPLVVLVHGFSVPSYIYDPTVDALSQAGCRVLRYDHYGRGFSARPDLEYNPELFQSQLIRLLDSLGIEDRINLVGLSMGGGIVARLAGNYPERIRSIALLDPVGFAPMLSSRDRLRLLPGVGEWTWWRKNYDDLQAGLSDDLTEPGRFPLYWEFFEPQTAFTGYRRALLSSLRHGMLDEQRDVYRVLARTGLPVMLIWGRQDRVISPANADIARELLPGLTVHMIDRAGHIPHFERPEVVNPLLLEFCGQ